MNQATRSATAPERRALRVTGTVQGVGFRPFVHRLATEMGLTGQVGNDADGVFVDLQGPPDALDDFQRRLSAEAPPLADIQGMTAEVRPPTDHPDGFRIVPSTPAGGPRRAGAPADTATCRACRAEMADPADRRFRHPFITCTDCGPRFTIITRLPYDRPATTMAGFALCPTCAAEYTDPSDRRFHAQPVACHDCGPRLALLDSRGRSLLPALGDGTGDEGVPGPRAHVDAVLAGTQRLLAEGAIVAVKGIGGYHLACRADDDATVARLRARKHRPGKPLALLVDDLATAESLAHVSPSEAELLASPAAPIVLLRRRVDHQRLSGLVAPGNPLVGVMLASNPLHHLLLTAVPDADVAPTPVLVMTSGNRSEEPICIDDADALGRLGDIADAFLSHDRPIAVPCDDSVVRVLPDGPSLVRRSRGWVPQPLRLPVTGRPALALGAELKATVCLSDGIRAWPSAHLGDMGSLETLRAFEAAVARTEAMHDVRADLLACDAHPDHTAHRWARRRQERLVTVQHHHAHVAACMVEHGLAGPVIGVAFDGTGYGTDGTIWGGEVLIADLVGFERAVHLSPVLLPGGDAAIRHPRRVALSHLHAAGIAWEPSLPPVAATAEEERRLLAVQLKRAVNAVPTTSMGRLFDAVASLLGVRHDITFEAQAAIELEVLATDHADAGGSPEPLSLPLAGDAWDCTTLVSGLVAALSAGAGDGALALGFHHAVARAVRDACQAQREAVGLSTVCLTGGVFANALLVGLTTALLTDDGFTVRRHRLVPPNDGGISLGQAAVAVATGQAEAGQRPGLQDPTAHHPTARS